MVLPVNAFLCGEEGLLLSVVCNEQEYHLGKRISQLTHFEQNHQPLPEPETLFSRISLPTCRVFCSQVYGARESFIIPLECT